MTAQTISTKANSDIFKVILQTDDLRLFKKTGKPDYDKVKDILGYTKQDISIASGVPFGSIRFDGKVPAELTERFIEWATAITLVHSFFKNETKTMLWFKVPNPMLGDVAPREMIKVGRFRKLLNFIQSALEDGR